LLTDCYDSQFQWMSMWRAWKIFQIFKKS
jgi:hypothetical protein